jgi:hypothetical protein
MKEGKRGALPHNVFEFLSSLHIWACAANHALCVKMSGASEVPSGSQKRKRRREKEAQLASLTKITKWLVTGSATPADPATPAGPMAERDTDIDSTESCLTPAVSTNQNYCSTLHT